MTPSLACTRAIAARRRLQRRKRLERMATLGQHVLAVLGAASILAWALSLIGGAG